MTLASPNTHDLNNLQGQVFADRYHLTRLIDSGGFGAVYEATDKKFTDVRVAIKLSKSVASERAFTREAQLIRQLNHENVVKVFDYGVHAGIPFIVMELLHGEHLDSLLEQYTGRLPDDLIVKFIREVGRALRNVHRKQLVHRDLKPKNIVLVDTGDKDDDGSPICKFVLLDFGISSKVDAGNSLANQTMAGAGTPEYMSPEQIASEEPTAKTDLYSFGVLLYLLMTERLPFQCEGNSPGDIAKVVLRISSEPPPRPNDVAKQPIDPDVEDIILRCLEKNPEDRPESVNSVRKELLNILDDDGRRTVDGIELPTNFDPTGTVRPIDLAGQPAVQSTDPPRSWATSNSTTLTPNRTTLSLAIVFAVIFVAIGVMIAVWLFPWGGASVTRDPVEFLVAPNQLTVTAGEAESFQIQIQRHDFDAPIELRTNDAPEGVRLTVPESADEGSTMCEIGVDLAPLEGVHTIAVTAINAETQEELGVLELELTIRKPPIWMPPAGRFGVHGSGDLRRQVGMVLYERLEFEIPGGKPLEFVLIEQRPNRKREVRKEPPFYIMADKVWRGLYQQFFDDVQAELVRAEKNRRAEVGDTIDDDATLQQVTRFNDETLGRGDLVPALSVTVNEAFEFARWLEGAEGEPSGLFHLPTTTQWYIATGYHDLNEDQFDPTKGPFQGTGAAIAIDVGAAGTAADVGSMHDDVSPWHVRDMAGNGWEWVMKENQVLPVDDLVSDEQFPLAGQDFMKSTQLTWGQIENRVKENHDMMYWFDRDATVGFRVVIEIKNDL